MVFEKKPKEEKPKEIGSSGKAKSYKTSRPKKTNNTHNRGLPDFSGEGPPKPRALSTDETPFKNDPLMTSIFDEPGTSQSAVVGVKKIYPEATGMTALIEAQHVQLSAASVNMRRSISQSMFAYYAACLIWRRMLVVSAERFQVLTPDEIAFIDRTKEYHPPGALGAYISGIGNTGYVGGFSDYKMDILKPTYTAAARDILPGYFGQIRHNAAKYANYPCISVFAQRIMQDLNHQAADTGWDLPANTRYAGHPINRSCLGYAPTISLDTAAKGTLALCGITSTYFPYELNTIALSVRLMNEVQAWINEIKDINTVSLPTSLDGSRGQLYISNLAPDPPGQELLRGTWVSYSLQKLQGAVEFAGTTFLYRVDKSIRADSPLSKAQAFCPFDIGAIGAYPADMNELRVAETSTLLDVRTEGVCAQFLQSQRIPRIIRLDFRPKAKPPS